MKELLLVVLFALNLVSISAAADCDALGRLVLPSTAIATAQQIPAGVFVAPSGARIGNMPAFCRVAGTIRPSSDSDIQFEVWSRRSDSSPQGGTAGPPLCSYPGLARYKGTGSTNDAASFECK
jgi:hypothetical protein